MIGGQHHHAGAWHRIVVKGWGHQGSDQVDEVHSHVYKGWDHLSMCPSWRAIQVSITKGSQGHRELETVLSLLTNMGNGLVTIN